MISQRSQSRELRSGRHNSFWAELHKPICGEMGHDIVKVSWVIVAFRLPNPLLAKHVIQARGGQKTLPPRRVPWSNSHARPDQSGGHTRPGVSIPVPVQMGGH